MVLSEYLWESTSCGAWMRLQYEQCGLARNNLCCGGRLSPDMISVERCPLQSSEQFLGVPNIGMLELVSSI